MNNKLGPTGDFPHGKLNASDEGALSFVIGEDSHNVVVRFDTPVAWLAMPPEQAVTMAQLLIAKPRIIARKQGKPLVVTL